MTTAPRYNSASDRLAILATILPSMDRRRIEFEALSTADQDAHGAEATAQIDACLWVGVDAVAGQLTRWPRIWGKGRVLPGSELSADSYVDSDPNAPANPLVAHLPAAVRLAEAVQSAHNAMLAAGLSPNAHIDEAANKGITSQSVGGVSQTTDLKRANSSWAALCREAQRFLAPYRRAGGSMV